MATSIYFLSIAFLILCWPNDVVDGQRAKPGDFPWRFRLRVANSSDNFEGRLNFDIYFDSKSNQSKPLAIDSNVYEPGSTHDSLQKLTENGMSNILARVEARAISISTIDNCTDDNGRLYKTLSIGEISLTSFHKRKTFRKRFVENQPLRIRAECQQRNVSVKTNISIDEEIVEIDNFESIPSNDCYYRGEFYDADQTFDLGCEMKCRCKEGMVDCDSMCKPSGSPLPRNCRMASVDRRCCDEIECMEDALWDSCPVHTAARDKMPPWAVVLNVPRSKIQNATDQKNCGASIIHKKLLITSAYCVKGLQSPKDKLSIFVTPSIFNSSVIGRAVAVHVHPAYDGKDAAGDLALIELSQDGLSFGESLRRVNLPWPTLCKRYVVPNCAVQYTSVDDFDSYVATVVAVSKFCPGSVRIATSPSPPTKSQQENGTEGVFCVQRMTDGFAQRPSSAEDPKSTGQKCNQITGNGVVTKRAQYHYIIGVAAHDYKIRPDPPQSPKAENGDQNPESILARSERGDQSSDLQKSIKADEAEDESCYRPSESVRVAVTNLCPHIDWLKTTINDILEKE